MSKSFTQTIKDALAANEITMGFLFQFQDNDDNYYRYTTFDVPVFHATDGTNVYEFEARGFSFSSITYSSDNLTNDMTLELDNLDSTLTALFGSYDLRGNSAKLWLILLDNNNTEIDSILLYGGIIGKHSWDEERLTINITSTFVKWHETTKGKHSTYCQWLFKGEECKYVGVETECDHTYTQCSQYTNTANYGGFRFLADMMNDSYRWWGPTPAQRNKEIRGY